MALGGQNASLSLDYPTPTHHLLTFEQRPDTFFVCKCKNTVGVTGGALESDVTYHTPWSSSMARLFVVHPEATARD